MVTAYSSFTKYTGKISNSGHDEKGTYRGGADGDQTGSEWAIRSWYSRPWTVMIRFKNQKIAAMFATLEILAALNPHVGYDQGERLSYWTQLQKVGYDPSKITTNCEDDCSAGVAANVKAALILLGMKDKAAQISAADTTWTLQDDLKQTGLVSSYTDAAYLTGYANLRPGDILLNPSHHVCAYVGGSFPATTSTTILRKGMKGSAVKTMQAKLIKNGYDLGASGADGDFGSDTETAVKYFQKNHGLTADGEYGPKTKAALDRANDLQKVAKEVIAGKWGNGSTRTKKLEAAGYDAKAVQVAVNKLV